MEDLQWRRISDRHWDAREGLLHYVARMDGRGIWRLKMNNSPLGEKRGFPSFEAVKDYVEYGSVPSRKGYDRTTGEVQDATKPIGETPDEGT